MQIRNADIVVSAAGRAGLVKGNWIRPGAVVVDVAMNTVGETCVHTEIDMGGVGKVGHLGHLVRYGWPEECPKPDQTKPNSTRPNL